MRSYSWEKAFTSDMTPTALSLNYLRRYGFIAAPVERRIERIQRRADLWRFGDVLAAHPRDKRIIIVQCTSLAHVGDRLAKAKQQPELGPWLRSGGEFQVWGWAKGEGLIRKVVVCRTED